MSYTIQAKAGYTWKVMFETYSRILDMWVDGYFYTTDDALMFHIESLENNPNIKNIATISIE